MKRKRVADPSLAEKGRLSYNWALSRMSLIGRIVQDNKSEELALEGTRLGICLHITKETAVLVMAAKRLGARIALCSANPLSAQDHVAAFLDTEGIDVFAWRGETEEEYRSCIRNVSLTSPQIIIDDGGDLHSEVHSGRSKNMPSGGTEETTSGVKRLKALEREGKLGYPVIAVNNARTKFLFDNRHGAGQSAIDGILRSTGVLLSGKNLVVCGYGWVGKGVAERARGMGAIVAVTEVDPVKALEAHMDGFTVKKLIDAASIGDIFVTCTGQTSVIREEHIRKMKDGAILANAGHFNVEIDAASMSSAFGKPSQIRENVEQFMVDEKRLYLLCEGRVVNLVAAEGNPPEVMAMSFANQLISAMHIARNSAAMDRRVYDVPLEIDRTVAEYALQDQGLAIDSLTEEQQKYLESS